MHWDALVIALSHRDRSSGYLRNFRNALKCLKALTCLICLINLKNMLFRNLLLHTLVHLPKQEFDVVESAAA